MNVFNPQEDGNVKEILIKMTESRNEEEGELSIVIEEVGKEVFFEAIEEEIEIVNETNTGHSSSNPMEVHEDVTKKAELTKLDITLDTEEERLVHDKPIIQVKGNTVRFTGATTDRNENDLEISPFEDDFRLIPNFGLSIDGPKAQIQSMMLRILQQDPEIFKKRVRSSSPKKLKIGRQFDVLSPTDTNSAIEQFKIPEHFRTYLRRSPQWIESSYW
eukprot:TRINITY_DN76232_c0_g1_i1.p1 TRINITY_DN76232_c0_g1~~TRINITY_DN76232_c0_g1_i1.p1  ORF type:complete len:246 (-),score=65.31 TRINITY_DN76232_c0_g1_i1:37-687(-)